MQSRQRREAYASPSSSESSLRAFFGVAFIVFSVLCCGVGFFGGEDAVGTFSLGLSAGSSGERERERDLLAPDSAFTPSSSELSSSPARASSSASSSLSDMAIRVEYK